MMNMNLYLLILCALITLNEATPPNSYRIYIGDFDGNHKADFLRQRTSYSGFSFDNLNIAELYFNPIAWSKSSALNYNFFLNGDLTNLYIGDFNGDGRDDILRQEKGAWDNDKVGTAELLLSAACACRFDKIVLPEEFNLGGDFANLYVGDFNGDGKDDFLRQDLQSSIGNVFLSQGNGNFTNIVLPANFNLTGVVTNLYIGDFNGDGMDDFIRQAKGPWDDARVNTAYLLLATGNGTFQKIVLSEDYNIAGDRTNLLVGDFNGDGKDDVLRQRKGEFDYYGNNIANLLMSTGTGFQLIGLPDNLGLPGNLTNLFVGDFNGDGKADLLRQEKSVWDDDDINTAYLLISDGNNNFQQILLSEDLNIKGDYTSLYVGDFDKDGKTDFLKYWGNNLMSIYLSHGNGEWTKKDILY